MSISKVTIYRRPNRAKSWLVEFRNANRKRKGRFFATRDEAETYATARRIEFQKLGLKALDLSDTARHHAQQALELLSPYGKSILEASQFYVAHLEQTAKSCTIEELVENFLMDKQADQVSERHLKDLEDRLKRFARAFQGKLVNLIETEEISDWIRGLGLAPQTQRNYRRVLLNLFNYAIAGNLPPKTRW